MDVELHLNAEAKMLFEQTGELCAFVQQYVFQEVLRETVGPNSIAVNHFNRGQGAWPSLSPKWLADKRKGGTNKKFFLTGAVRNAIGRRANDGEMLPFGASGAVKKDRFKIRYVSGAIWVICNITTSKSTFECGFNGTFKHSAAFEAARKIEAGLRGAKKGKRGGVTAKESRRAATIAQAQRRLSKGLSGKGPVLNRKFAAVGSKGVEKLARGADNLAYANVLQRGVFKGLKSATGKLLNPQTLGRLRTSGGGVKAEDIKAATAQYGKAMPLMPYESSDIGRLQTAMERGLTRALHEGRLIGFLEEAA
jgi:hypothetical protein